MQEKGKKKKSEGIVRATGVIENIDSNVRGKRPMPEIFREIDNYWNESQGNVIQGAHASDGWISEFSQNRERYDNPDAWANSFEQQHDQVRGMNMQNIAAMEQTRMLANTLAQNADPKFQNSKFFQFVSKMSRDELIINLEPFCLPYTWLQAPFP
ncbi:hypothetical protein RYX36_028258, partial [Vicia faba]